MKTIKVGSNLTYTVNSTTSFLFKVSVDSNAHQKLLDETIEVSPALELETCHTGLLGNRVHRMIAQPGEVSIAYRAMVELDQTVARETDLMEVDYANLPADVLPFLNPSRYCESDKLLKFAWEEFGKMSPGYSRAEGIADRVFNHLSYTPVSITPTTTA